MHHLQGLNTAQREAVTYTEGPLLIVAGAGAGKTKTITHRIVHLITLGINPKNILAVTFTNKAATEMRERVHSLLAESREHERPFIATFHALGVAIVKEHAQKLGRTQQFTIMDEHDTLALLKEILIRNQLDPKIEEPRKYRAIISREKGRAETVESYTARASNFREELIATIWRSYELQKKKENVFDFDDLLCESFLLLKNNSEIREHYQKRWQYIHVDEYQDTNEVQYELTKLLTTSTRNICAVGDADQNIYSWRGANLKNMLRFEKDYPNAKIIFLEENYRSTNTILDAANAIIAHNTLRVPKNLFTAKKGGEHISLIETWGETDEAEFVAMTASSLIEAGKRPSAIAVLYRANFQSRVLEEAMLNHTIAYQVLGTKFFDRREIKDVLSYLRASQNETSLADIKRIINTPSRGIGKVTLVKLFQGDQTTLPPAMQLKIKSFFNILKEIKTFASANMPSETIRYIIEISGLKTAYEKGTEEEQERLENMEELVTLATRYNSLGPTEGIDTLLVNAALAGEQDSLEGAQEGVRLMTIHAAKGLEFDVVFIVGLEEGLFPHEKDPNVSLEEFEEERRLFYVALTRAREKLYLSYATSRTIYGMRELKMPSSFIKDIPESLIERSTHSGESMKIIYLD